MKDLIKCIKSNISEIFFGSLKIYFLEKLNCRLLYLPPAHLQLSKIFNKLVLCKKNPPNPQAIALQNREATHNQSIWGRGGASNNSPANGFILKKCLQLLFFHPINFLLLPYRVSQSINLGGAETTHQPTASFSNFHFSIPSTSCFPKPPSKILPSVILVNLQVKYLLTSEGNTC